MNTSLTKYREMTPDAWKMIESVAPVMMSSRLFGVSTEQQAMAIMAKGYELGLPLTSAFEYISVIQDRPTLSPRGALALVQQSGELADLRITDRSDDAGVPAACTVYMKRRNGTEYEATFSMADAKRAGILRSGSGWEKYPANMMRWRAIGFCADVVFPDIIGGMKRSDELGADLTEEGDVIDGSWAIHESETDAGADGPATIEEPDLTELVNRYGADAVMAANGGSIPRDAVEVAATAQKLAEV